MSKNPNTFQKRQREFDKKLKAEEKRKRKQATKAAAVNRPAPGASVPDQNADADN